MSIVSDKFFNVTDVIDEMSSIKEEPDQADRILLQSTEEYNAPTTMEVELLPKEEIDINWDENNDPTETTNENYMFSNKSFFIKSIKLGGLSSSVQNQFANVIPENFNQSVEAACSKSDKIMQSSKQIETISLSFESLIKYQCNKCSYETWSNWHIKYHNKSTHIPKECPKCKRLCKNEKSLTVHSKKFCQLRNTLHSCDICSYQCDQISMLNSHIQLMHSAKPEYFRVEERIFVPEKRPNNFVYNEQVNQEPYEQDNCENNLINQIKNNKTSCYINNNLFNLVNKATTFCPKCNIATELDEKSKCITCKTAGLFRCNQCYIKFKNRQRVLYHLKTRCSLKGHYHCLKCDFRSPYKFRVRHHLEKHHLEICDPLQSTNELEYIEYRELQSYKNEDENSDIKCTICGMQFDHSADLNRHSIYCRKTQHVFKRINQKVGTNGDLIPEKYTTVLKHKNVKQYVVRYCVKCNKDIELEHYGVNMVKSCENCNTIMVYKCLKCGKLGKNLTGISRHLKTLCHPDEILKCNECDYTAYFSDKMSEHYQEVHAGFSATCMKCQKTFSNSTAFKRHLVCCGAQRRFLCNYCPYKAKTKRSLKNHITSIHIKPPPEVTVSTRDRFNKIKGYIQPYCMNCYKRMAVKCRVKKCNKCKKMLHFRCVMCDKTFISNDRKACEHVKNYLKMLKFECPRCGKGFSIKETLGIHMYTCGTSPPSYTCKFCNYISNTKVDVRKHQQKVHSARTRKLEEQKNIHENKYYHCNDCSYKVVGKLHNLKRHILKYHIKGKHKSKLPPCDKCNWDFKSNSGLKKHLAYCGKKLYLQCSVVLTRVKIEPLESNEIKHET